MPKKAQNSRTAASNSVGSPTDQEASKPYHHGDLRNTLIEAGVSLIREKGPEGFSLREAARIAGVSHTAPYRHFADRRALLEAVAAEGFLALALAMEKSAQDYPDDPEKQLRAAGRAYVLLAVRNPEKTQLMFGGGMKPEDCGEDLVIVGQRAFQGLLNIVENGRAAGIYGERDTMTLALAVWSQVHGLAMLQTVGQLGEQIPDEKTLISVADAVAEIIFHGMLRKSE